MNKKRIFFIMVMLAVAGTLGYTFTPVMKHSVTAFVSFATNTPNNAIMTEANYILSCQADASYGAGMGAINDVVGAPTWVVPRENGTAVIGLIEAYAATGNAVYRTRALQCLEYLKLRQEVDGGWSKHYDENMHHVRVDSATSPSEAGSVIMAMYKAHQAGWEDPSHQYYDAAKKAGQFIIDCITNKPGTPTGLAGAGKEYTGGPFTGTDDRGAYKWSDWSWVSDNCYAYLGLISLREWAVAKGDYALARTCNQYVIGIYNGMNTYLKNPGNAVWYRAVDGNANPVDAGKKEALCYYPQKYDIPLPQYKDPNIAQWMVDNLQVTNPAVTVPQGYGAFIWADAGDGSHPNRRSQGYSEEAWLALADIPGQTALDARTRAKNWWEAPDNTNGIITVVAPLSYQLWDVVFGGILDWYDPDTNSVAPAGEKFIDTSANCILVYRGGYDHTAGIPYLPTTQPPQITHTPIAQVSPLNTEVEVVGDVSASAPLRSVTLTYFTDAKPSPVVLPGIPGGASAYHFSFKFNADLASATSFYYVIHTVDSAGNEALSPASGYHIASVANAAIASIGAGGGTITLTEGNQFGGHTSIVIPPGALSSSQTITVAEVRPEEVDILPPTGQYTLGVDIPVVMYQFMPEGLTFDMPATITLLYPDANNDNFVDGTGLPASSLTVLWWNKIYQQWEYVGGTVDTALKTVTCQITHFSVYGVGFAGPLRDDDYRPLQKIITPASADGVNDFGTFKALTVDDLVTIYDVTGRRIRELRSQSGEPVSWNGKDQDGRIVESGIYIYQIKLHGKNKPISGTIVVAK